MACRLAACRHGRPRTGMTGGLGDQKDVGEDEAAMVQSFKPNVEKYKKVTFDSFIPVGMRTQVRGRVPMSPRMLGSGVRAICVELADGDEQGV